jgi:hypothetical protein
LIPANPGQESLKIVFAKERPGAVVDEYELCALGCLAQGSQDGILSLRSAKHDSGPLGRTDEGAYARDLLVVPGYDDNGSRGIKAMPDFQTAGERRTSCDRGEDLVFQDAPQS